MQSEAMQAFSADQAQNLPSTPEGVARRYDSSIVVRRWGATLIDYIALGAFLALALLLPERFQAIAISLLILPAIAYFPVFEHLFGRTLGKTVCRVQVVDAKGGRPSWGQAILRALLRVAEVNPVLLGGIPAGIIVLSTKARQRLGDIVAGTFVLRTEDLAYLQPLPFQGGAPAAVQRPLPPLPVSTDGNSSDWLLPTGRSGWAIAAGYLGLFSVLAFPAPFALAAGILGLLDIRRNPRLGGRGRAIFGIVMGSLGSILLIVFLVMSLQSS